MKSAAVYLMLVGLPVLGVLAVLRAGADLPAPPALGGAWRVVEGARCVLDDSVVTIEQSGQFVHLALPGRAPLRARLRGTALTAQGGERLEVAPGCGAGPVRLRARASGRIAARLDGTLGIPGCSVCPERQFVAVRDTAAAPRDPSREH